MELAVEEFQGIHNNVLEQLAELQRSIAEIKAENVAMKQEIFNEKDKRKRAEAKARRLDQQLKYAQKTKFGDKRQKAHKDVRKEWDAINLKFTTTMSDTFASKNRHKYTIWYRKIYNNELDILTNRRWYFQFTHVIVLLILTINRSLNDTYFMVFK